MRIPEEVRKCVGFIGHQSDDGHATFHGTVFFVYVQIEPGANVLYGVTAAHVLTGMFDAGIRAPMIRLNPRVGDGKAEWFITSYKDWALSDPVEDTAVIRLPAMHEQFDFRAVSIFDMSVNDNLIEKHDIGPGNEVFIPGLFLMFDDPRRVYGIDRNIPIVRAGHIAAMPGELVPTAAGAMDAYLVEARSIGGLSGSPVFVHLGSVFVRDGIVHTAKHADGTPRDAGVYFLLGHVHGHFPILADTPSPTAAGASQSDVNMGITVVVPTTRVAAFLNRPEEREWRQSELLNWRRENVPDSPSGG